MTVSAAASAWRTPLAAPPRGMPQSRSMRRRRRSVPRPRSRPVVGFASGSMPAAAVGAAFRPEPVTPASRLWLLARLSRSKPGLGQQGGSLGSAAAVGCQRPMQAPFQALLRDCRSSGRRPGARPPLRRRCGRPLPSHDRASHRRPPGSRTSGSSGSWRHPIPQVDPARLQVRRSPPLGNRSPPEGPAWRNPDHPSRRSVVNACRARARARHPLAASAGPAVGVLRITGTTPSNRAVRPVRSPADRRAANYHRAGTLPSARRGGKARYLLLERRRLLSVDHIRHQPPRPLLAFDELQRIGGIEQIRPTLRDGLVAHLRRPFAQARRACPARSRGRSRRRASAIADRRSGNPPARN